MYKKSLDMEISNAQSNARKTWRTKETRGFCTNGNLSEGAERTSQSLEFKPLGDDREAGQGGTASNKHSTPTTGGILEQLLKDTIEQLLDAKRHVEQLENRVTELKELASQIEGKQ